MSKLRLDFFLSQQKVFDIGIKKFTDNIFQGFEKNVFLLVRKKRVGLFAPRNANEEVVKF